MELLLGVRLSAMEKMSVVKLNDVNLKENIQQLRTKTSEEINLPADSFDLIYCGCLLENESSIESCGLKNGSMVHVLKKNEVKDPALNSASTSSEEVNPVILSCVFKSFLRFPLLELALKRLTKKPDVIENIISSSPGLNEDAVAVAFLQDSDLIVHFTNAESMEKIAKLHPALLEAAQHIASAVHDEAHSFAASSTSANSSALSNAQGASTSYSYMSDDEEMAGDSSQSSDSTQPSSSTNQSRNNSIANAQLLDAMSRSGRFSTSTDMSNTSTPVPSHSRSNSNSGGVITFEMFHQAMQQAFASSPATSTANSTPQPSPSPAAAFANNTVQNSSDGNNMQRQISIMHEMGLQNDAVNLQALQVTNGDVQAAIELVLSGFGDN